ncbi:unnamed protein product [Adineta steineri]|uniref:Uncharacterized protein n=1 Tax=Adineta steineri TaxID=433720 RepID=A0A819BVP2_9BILA|nr:unnamed protein product [Adineta steineri]CAF1376112.1 unnamed protein product [Adineta steineri]CAF3810148.1 unnamed protein product [Adineta steineri]CAF4094338.1 unnamed protein product [Adineta steineri]
MKLCTHLFSQLESLTISLHKIDLESIVRFILLELQHHIRYLSSLCISKQHKDFLEPMKNLIDSEKLIPNYTIKLINKRVHLWW